MLTVYILIKLIFLKEENYEILIKEYMYLCYLPYNLTAHENINRNISIISIVYIILWTCHYFIYIGIIIIQFIAHGK